MKRILYCLALLVPVIALKAQDVKLNEIKTGTVLVINALAQGQTYPMTLTVSSATDDELVFDYNVMGSMTGKFVNQRNNLEKGIRFNWDQPYQGEERKVPDDQTLLVVSRNVLKELKASKKSNFAEQVLILKDIPAGSEININGRMIDAVYAESENGATKYWILNNDLFPVILKLEGNPEGIDLVLTDFK